MAIDSNYIPAFSIEEVLLDKDTGAPLTGGVVTFEQANQPGVLKPVYQITGTDPNYTYTQLPNPMTLSAIGTFQDAMDNPVVPYFFPYDGNFEPEYYRVIVESSGGVEQFVRDPVPYIPDSGSTAASSAFTNELSNPQFAEVLFPTDSAFVYNYSAASLQVTPIAPNWDLIVSSAGAATVTVELLTPIGSLNRISNPGTILNITSGGVSRLRLRQRIYGSPNLWGSDNVSATFIAKTYEGTSSTLDLYYSQSNGVNQVTPIRLVRATLVNDGLYRAYPGSAAIPASTSTESFPNAYVDIEFDLPLNTQIDISSVMVAGTGTVSVPSLVYEQTSYDRQVDLLFHYYKPQLEYKPIPSYLVGWDFRLNPCQELGTTVTALALGANKSRYIADQTIAFESADNVTSYALSSATGLTITTASASNPAIIQYLPANIARELLSQRMSLKMKANVSGTTLTGTVSMYWTTDASLPTVTAGTNNSLVSAVALGIPSVGGGGIYGTWTQLTQVGRGTAGYNSPFSLTTSSTELDFNSFESAAQAGATTATYLAVVIAFNSLSGQTVTVDYVSLVGGDIATRPAAQSEDEVLRQCEFYYEKSYETGTAALIPPASHPATGRGALSIEQLGAHIGGNNAFITRMYQIDYKTVKRARPAIGINAVDGTASSTTIILYNNGVVVTSGNLASNEWSSVTTADTTSTKRISFRPVNVTPRLSTVGGDTFPEGTMQLHYTADARLGIVN